MCVCVCVCVLGVSRYLHVYICLWDIWTYVCASLGVSEFSLCFSVCVCVSVSVSDWVSGCAPFSVWVDLGIWGVVRKDS